MSDSGFTDGRKGPGGSLSGPWNMNEELRLLFDPCRKSGLHERPLAGEPSLAQLFRNFDAIHGKVRGIYAELDDLILERGQCRGCGSCCGPAPVSASEAICLLVELSHGSMDQAARNFQIAMEAAIMGFQAGLMPPCPLRCPGGCLAYAARPLACRTFGVKGVTRLPSLPDCVNINNELRVSEARGVALIQELRIKLRAFDISFSPARNCIYLNSVEFHSLFHWFRKLIVS